ncbi:MAG TPA: phospho-N-acetylmuramoyl-pentapeptide-transferase [Candidatus Hydrogenedens sp.]|nr:phospho-N-acetylmuramoyl-pentapeptide-transferase [Candidatus Hydrogenedens sp.]HOL18720.1 phospho-N-acetylmuramoyl-pentapeptide-transferase [Candidatus Hydrogenedens sp.]HPP58483.1 phospho-N-acetylmuramoyl-pentapeptide-transferase [Candidatus Hydrogenedens sp.]
MLYYIAILLIPYIDLMNVLTYHTVRAGGAVFTSFLLTLFIGPSVIHKLREMKIGQYIKKEYVEDLHQLHKGKAGTPTMGGILILISTCISLLIWGRLTNRCLWLALIIFVALGILGFVDDYIKLKRKHNDGLRARDKLLGQILIGVIFGIYLYFNPITPGPIYIVHSDVKNWALLCNQLSEALKQHNETPHSIICSQIPPILKEHLLQLNLEKELEIEEQLLIIRVLNQIIDNGTWHQNPMWKNEDIGQEAMSYLLSNKQLIPYQKQRLSRLILEHVFKDAFYPSPSSLHTKVGVPGFKNLFIPLGILYILFVAFIVVSVSNAVNLTDGLDGLAIGCSIISIMAYAAIAYIVSRADWSRYLFLTYVPEASELFVFGSTLLGAGLGFLWYNGHPAEVFMGDTGSLSLGGALATLAVLTKQELLLPIVAGIFVLEAGSVLLQVASFKLTGKRIFRMSPLHHHFELLGWTETKVTLRFWIIALLFALLSLGTLKLR